MITKRQKQILDFVRNFESKNEYAPSLKEIKKHFKLSSESTVHEHLETLKDKGYLQKYKNQPRGIEITKLDELINIPIIGTIAAGQPIAVIEYNAGMVTIPKHEIGFRNDRHYALKVAGDSMIDEGIFDGDVVIIREQSTADDGQTVVAVIDDNQATLKKIYREKNRFRLQPANQTLLPFYRTEVEIRGVVEKIIRNLEHQISNVPISIQESEPVTTNLEKTKGIFTTNEFEVNKIYNIDCLKLTKQIKDNSIDLVFADPPYNLSGSNFKMKFTKSGGADLNTNKGKWDRYSDDEFEEFTKKWLTESYRILKSNGAIWVAGTYHNIYLTGYLMKKIGFEILNEVLWHKSDATPNLSCTRFVADHENFIWARKGKGNVFNYSDMKIMNGGKQMRSIWTKGKTAGGKKIHPTQKPEWLLERVITATSNPNNIVFDPFIGSGTTAVVAKKFKRQYLGAELDKDFYKKAVERINNTQICNNII